MTVSFLHKWAMPKALSAALAMAGFMGAQWAQAASTLAPFTRYVVTQRIASTSGTTTQVPAAINEAGEVGGTLVKPAGRVWKWLPPSGNVWDGTLGLFPKLVYTQYVNAYPAIWSGASVTQLAQYGGTHSTWITGKTSTGKWLVASSAEPGRFPDRVADRTIHVPIKQARWLTSQGLYGDVIGAANLDASDMRADENAAGTLAYQNRTSQAHDRSIHVVMNGQDQVVAPPEGLSDTRFVGLREDSGMLLSGYRHKTDAAGSAALLPSCYVYRHGQYWPVVPAVADAILDTACRVLLADGSALGFVTVANPFSTTVDRTAVYAWKDGQTSLLSDFRPDLYKGIPSLDGMGMSDVGMIARKDVAQFGIYRQGVFIDALASAGVVVKSTEYVAVLSHNKAGQLLVQVQNDSANSKYYVVLSPR